MQLPVLRRRYKLWAKIYNRMLDPIFAFDRQSVIDAAGLKSDDQVLEVGVGTGLNLPYYPKDVSVTGVDVSKDMLERAASEQVPGTNQQLFLLDDPSTFPFPDHHFDAAVATFVLRVAPDQQGLLREVARVVKPGGLFVLYDVFQAHPVRGFLSSVSDWIGWGRDPVVAELIEETPWQIKTADKHLVVLQKCS